MNPAVRGAHDELVNLALIGLVAAFALALVLRAAATAAAVASGAAAPEGGIASGLRVLADPSRPARAFEAPGLSATAYWTAVTLLIGVVAVMSWCVWRLVTRLLHRSARDPRRIQGTATARDIDVTASKRALVRRAATLRPSIRHPRATDVGYLIGRSCGREIWASVEDSILVIGPPRSGKGLHLVINSILDAPGAVVTTSTRPDNIAATIDARKDRGPVAVFDPQHLTAGLRAVDGCGVRWSPIRGCEQPLTAMIRASGLASSTGLSSGGTESGGFWEGKARSALQALLHAAALEKLPTRALFEWSLSASAAADAVGILASHPKAAAGWADSLEGMISSDPRTRDSIWMAVAQALSCLADPAVLDAVSPEPGEAFDPRDFLTQNGTLYLLATGAGAGASWPLIAAFMEDFTEVAEDLGLQMEEPTPFTRNQFVPRLGRQNAAIGASFGLRPGQISEVVTTAANAFVIEQVSYAEADSAAWLGQAIQQRQTQAGIQQQTRLQMWVAALRAAARIVDRRAEVLAPQDEDLVQFPTVF